MFKERSKNDVAIKAQETYCRKSKLPLFAPLSGICYECGGDIYGTNGYSLKYASENLITGCPLCNKSYCD